MTMNTKIRFLVLDSSNTPVNPSSFGLKLATTQSAKSPSFLVEDDAIKFAQLCASRNVGERYYVAQIVGGAVAHHNLDALTAGAAERGAPTPTYIRTTAAGTGPEAA